MATRSKSNPVPGLPRFEGKDVIASSIAIRNAGDGLSAALQVEPVAYNHGHKVYVVLECDVADVQHPPAVANQYGGALVRKHIFKTVAGTVVDEDLVREVLDAQQKKIEEAAGIQRLDLGEPGGHDGEGDPYGDDAEE